MTTVYRARIVHMPSYPVRPELVATFATSAERDEFLKLTRADGWRPESISDLDLVTVATAMEEAATKILDPAEAATGDEEPPSLVV